MQIKIYNVKKEKFHDYLFWSYEKIMERTEGEKFPIEAYEKVYECEVPDSFGLDDIFMMFNLYKPEDYRTHSMSVSDIVEMENEMYFCDSFGWKKLSEVA